MEYGRKHPMSDEEDLDDVEALRIAALQSLKKKNEAANGTRPQAHSEQYFYHGGRPPRGSPNKRGRYFGNRNPRNGQHIHHNSRIQSSNLISLTPVGSAEDIKTTHPREKRRYAEKDSKFLLPQDRYCMNESKEEKTDDTTSKFDRYKDSDKSEDETDEDELLASDSEDDSPGKLLRHDSLEALMQELDDEIQGKSQPKEKDPAQENKPKVKIKKEKKKKDETKKEEEKKTPVVQEPAMKDEEKISLDKDNSEEKKEESVSEPTKVDSTTENLDKLEDKEKEEPLNKRRRLSDQERRDFLHFRDRRKRRSRSPNMPRNRNFPPPLGGPMPFPPPGPPRVFNPNFFPPGPPPIFDRPLSPLLINTETLQNQTMAPLSPRSAAFVLQNRAIIEKRKRSPRRSYSRSPSPRSRSISPRSPPLRRSPLSPRRRLRSPSPKPLNRAPLSPHRPLSPLRRRPLSPRRRSVSPKRRSMSPKRRSASPKRRSVSPKRRSASPKRRSVSPRRRPLSPRRRSVSPRRRSVSPRRRSLSPKRGNRKDGRMSPRPRQHIRDRLGQKSNQKSEKADPKVDKDKSTSISTQKKDSKEPGKPMDPVLEARKRKFESREIKVKEGVIRLKKDEPKIEKPDEVKKENIEKPKSDEKNETKTVEKEAKPVVEKKVEKDPESLLEDALLADDDFDLGLHLFSDEESGSENEGRFKEKEKNNAAKPPILPFTKLVKTTTKPPVKKPVVVKKEPEKKVVEEKKENPIVSEKKKEEIRSDTPPIPKKKEPITFDLPKEDDKRDIVAELEAELAEEKVVEKVKKKKSSDKLIPKNKSIIIKPEKLKKFERKIEIKIKNPSKYEKGGKSKEERKLEKKAKKLLEKMQKAQMKNANESEDETIIEEEDEGEVVDDEPFDSEEEEMAVRDGDLRAQLSKKRAGKLTKPVSSEQVNKRLLQSALQNALLKSSRSRSQEFSSSDGKLPIHLRLGLSGREGPFSGKIKRKTKRRKNRDVEEQV